MYTYYFKRVKKTGHFKLIANKCPEPDFSLGQFYNDKAMLAISKLGYRVVIDPTDEDSVFTQDVWNDIDGKTQMFYAKGYRGACPPGFGIAENANFAQKYIGEWPTEPAEPDQEFIDYANGVQRDYCSEDFGQERPQLDSVERENSSKFAESAKNESTPLPGIGPLPPQASIAPLPITATNSNAEYTWSWTWTGCPNYTERLQDSLQNVLVYNNLTPEEKEAEALKVANSQIAENAKPNLWSRFVDMVWPF